MVTIIVTPFEKIGDCYNHNNKWRDLLSTPLNEDVAGYHRHNNYDDQIQTA